jgi:hypothetical protein
VIIEIDIVLGSIVGRVQVVGVTWELGSDGIDLLDPWCDTSFDSKTSDSQLVRVECFGDLSIRESEALGISDKLNRDSVEVVVSVISPLSDESCGVELTRWSFQS